VGHTQRGKCAKLTSYSTLLAKIRLQWKCLSESSTPSFSAKSKITSQKKFYEIALRAEVLDFSILPLQAFSQNCDGRNCHPVQTGQPIGQVVPLSSNLLGKLFIVS